MYEKPWIVAIGLTCTLWIGSVMAAPSLTPLTVEQAVEQALLQSPMMKHAEALVDASRGEAEQAGVWSNPELSLEVENFAGSGPFKGTRSAEYTYGLSQKLEIGGKLTARKQAARMRIRAAEAERDAVRCLIQRDVTIAFMTVVMAQQKLALAREEEQLAAEILQTVRGRVDAARAPEIQQSKADVASATARLRRQQAERELTISHARLAAFWGGDTLPAKLDESPFFSILSPAPLGDYTVLLDDNPSLVTQRYRQLAQRSDLDLEKAQNIPDPTVSLAVRDFADTGDHALMAGISVPLPVFNRNTGNIRRARSLVTQAEQTILQTELDLSNALREAWQQWQQGSREVKELREQIIPTARMAFKLAQDGYATGRFPYLEVLDAQRTLFDTRAQYHDALLRLHAARATVAAIAVPKIGE